MTRWLCFVVAAALVGSSNSPPEKKAESKPPPRPVTQKQPPPAPQPPKKESPETISASKEEKSAVKTAQEAREELQARIDRCLGGQSLNDLLGGAIPIWAAGYRIRSMEIVRVIQKYN